jgi:hypothetical protein
MNRTHYAPRPSPPSPNPTLRCTNEKGARHFERRREMGLSPFPTDFFSSSSRGGRSSAMTRSL